MYIIYIYIHINLYNFCICVTCKFVICVTLKRRTSVGQALMKIKHKVKWMLKFVKTKKIIPLLPQALAHYFFSTSKHLGKIKLHMVFTLFAKIYKVF